ncbi:hypothetical protein EDC94DRAFT_612480 [Helicostylum pulchrum]|nr:hypothetical protein EDC94DRAFT_612480 [Helicostylum pulchrum]
MCRASLSSRFNIQLQPSTVWTFSDQDVVAQSSSKEKTASLLFREVAQQLIINGENGFLNFEKVKKSDSLCKFESTTRLIFDKIRALFKEEEKLKIKAGENVQELSHFFSSQFFAF